MCIQTNARSDNGQICDKYERFFSHIRIQTAIRLLVFGASSFFTCNIRILKIFQKYLHKYQNKVQQSDRCGMKVVE